MSIQTINPELTLGQQKYIPQAIIDKGARPTDFLFELGETYSVIDGRELPWAKYTQF